MSVGSYAAFLLFKRKHYGPGISVGISVGVSVGISVDVPVGVSVGVLVVVGAPVDVEVEVAEALPSTMMSTNTSSPKYIPAAVDILQLPRKLPDVRGAVKSTDSSISLPGLTALSSVSVEPPIAFPPVKLNLNPASQAQEPLFLTRQVFVNF
jgi:hypothetical protein